MRAAGRQRRPRRRQAGFSLLEVLVAFSIMMLALGVLYQAVGGSVRHLAQAERQTHAILLAQSLLELHQTVPAAGLAASGSAPGGLEWTLATAPAAALSSAAEGDAWPLHRLDIEVAWQDGERRRRYALATLLPERAPSAPAATE